MTDNDIILHLRNNRYSLAVKGLYHILPAVKQYIKANNGSADDAQDIFQDALVILYKKIQDGNLVLSVPLKTYLMAVVKNCWLQELRRRNKLPVTENIPDIALEENSEEPGFVAATAAFNLLGEKCKDLLMLFYFKKKSFKEIAAQLAFSDERTAKNQKYRCLQKAKDNYVTLLKNGGHE
ncbi:RNA polymerase sigma factor [Ferruginibacter sp.]